MSAPAPKSLAPTETVGNAAAMLEALKQVQIGFDNNVIGPIGDRPNDWEIDEAKRLRVVVDSALSAPARNCDRFATVDDAKRAYIAERGHVFIWDGDSSERFERWLFAPAEGGDHANA